MTEPKFPQYTPVKHKKDGYKGWIDGTTSMKDCFTGNKECEWQYRIAVKNRDSRYIAPEEDLEVIMEGAEFPPFLDISGVKSGFREETTLHALGYQITDMHWIERWNILLNVAVPILGTVEVVEIILVLMGARITNKQAAARHAYALSEWNRDLDFIYDKFADDPKIKKSDLMVRMKYIKKFLRETGIIEK